MSCYLYVDGESHYIRSRECWKRIHGEQAELTEIDRAPVIDIIAGTGFPNHRAIGADDKSHFFFDAQLLGQLPGGGLLPYHVNRAVYFTSFAGKAEDLHRSRVTIRDFGFEPLVIQERKTLADQRTNVLKQDGVIERAKGVDIGLTVRMLEDANRNNFQICFLCTSDIDYLPVIQAVRRMGKQVYVVGHQNGIGTDSPFQYEPDRFFDIGEAFMTQTYRRKAASPP